MKRSCSWTQYRPMERSCFALQYKIKFKLDTGAEVTAISLVTYEGLKPGKHMELGQPSKILYGPGNQALNVAGINPSNEGNEEPENVDDEENYQRHIQPRVSSPIAMHTRSRTGIAIRPPDRL